MQINDLVQKVDKLEKASNGLLDKFKHRHQIVNMRINSKAGMGDTKLTNNWKEKIVRFDRRL